MEKPFKLTIFYILGGFLIVYLFSLLGVYFAGSLNVKAAIYLFIANLLSTSFIVTILGGVFTSLVSHLLNLRRLIKLNNLTHPLLLRLAKEAPGTYHHSVCVADLAYKAAKEIGADALLVRIGGYFHDIGKLKDPSIFVENQEKRSNDLKEGNYKKNGSEIIAHVENGVKLAQEYHFPNELINLIAQHHGTSLAWYYFQKAKEANPLNVSRQSFRYKGPKPQTKEAALIMLADDVEARSRTFNREQMDLKKFENLVSNVIEEKIKEKQLSEVNFSTRDFTRITKAFVKTLTSIFHSRLEYNKNN